MYKRQGHWFIPLLQDSFFYKDDSFAEEDEWRVILKDEIIKSESDWENIYNWKRTGHSIRPAMKRLFPKALEFRVEDNDIVSYMDMDFSDGDYMHNDMIREVVIGCLLYTSKHTKQQFPISVKTSGKNM